MTSLNVIRHSPNNTADLKPWPWTEQKLPFDGEITSGLSKSSQESGDNLQVATELNAYKKDDVNQVISPFEDESQKLETTDCIPEILQADEDSDQDNTNHDATDILSLEDDFAVEPEVEPEIGDPINLPTEGESQQPEPDVEYPVKLPWEDDLQQPDTSVRKQFCPLLNETSGQEETNPEPADTIPYGDKLAVEPDGLCFENTFNVPPILHYHGFDYTQVLRGSRSCLYQQTLEGKTIAFEVFIIRVQPETTLNGKVYPSRERFPKDEDFGSTAWTYFTLEQAMKKYNELEEYDTSN